MGASARRRGAICYFALAQVKSVLNAVLFFAGH
jgi:hypothetical protein